MFCILDNVTTILLMAPVSILLAKQLKIRSFPFCHNRSYVGLNIGGLATLIGDPTQLIIGAEGKLTFNEFIQYSSNGDTFYAFPFDNSLLCVLKI